MGPQNRARRHLMILQYRQKAAYGLPPDIEGHFVVLRSQLGDKRRGIGDTQAVPQYQRTNIFLLKLGARMSQIYSRLDRIVRLDANQGRVRKNVEFKAKPFEETVSNGSEQRQPGAYRLRHHENRAVMLTLRPVGRGAAARKYDLLTALGAYALAQDKHDQRRVLRLMTLITARYNWARDELAVGQREIAQLWSCDERTVKREMALLRAREWFVVRRQGARGRVTQYSLGIERILQDTRDQWPCVGSDFELRMGVEETPKVVPLPVAGAVPAPDVEQGTEWALAQAVLHSEDAGSYASWLAALERVERAGGRLTLRAPSRFHAAYVQTHLAGRILTALREIDADVSDLRVVV